MMELSNLFITLWNKYSGVWDTRLFFISILFISIIRLKSVENKHNLSITKDQILPQDELKNGENYAWACKPIVVTVGMWKITFLNTT